MSHWGLFYGKGDEHEYHHVMPTDVYWNVLGGHICNRSCWCQPRLLDDQPVYIHNDPERGLDA